jgi:peptidoglycan/xylan/chitin deacetylase (PgdA/CDA1 family)
LDQLCEKFVPENQLSPTEFYVSPEELKEMETEGMLIGSHTVSHPVLSKLTKEEQKKEIDSSFETLSSFGLSLKTKTFCYPYGGFHSFTNETEQILEEEGCLFSFNVESRDIETEDLLGRRQALPRYDCNEFPFGQVRRLTGLRP